MKRLGLISQRDELLSEFEYLVSCGCITREHRMRRIVAAPRAVRQSLDSAWQDAKASAERVLAPIRTKVRWEGDA